jgi:hypothetical protein
MVQELWSLKIGKGVSSGPIKLSGQLWTLSLPPNENWGNSNTKILENFVTFLTVGRTQNFDLG